MSVKLLTEHDLALLSLKGGCTGSSESTLVKMLLCWKSHVMAQIVKTEAARQDKKAKKRKITDQHEQRNTYIETVNEFQQHVFTV